MKKKVLHVSFGGLSNGGVSSVIIGIVSKLYRQFDFGCIVFSKQCERESEFLKYGRLYRLNCYRTGNFFLKIFEMIFRPFIMTIGTFRICVKEKYQVIHCHNGKDMFFPLLGAKLANVPKRIAHSHNSKSPLKRNIIYRIYNFFLWRMTKLLATDFVGCSKIACDDFFEDKNYLIINNSIDLSNYVWKQERKNHVEFIHVGRFDYQKNQKFVIKVFENVKIRQPASILRLVGFGRDEQELRSLVSSKGLSESVLFFDGHNADIPKMLSQSDCMIFPSIYEGFGIVLLEAQASGCYCFASDVCPTDANVGFMENLPLSIGAEKWATRILNYLERNDCAETKDNVMRNLKKFDLDFIAQRYKQLYAE